MAKVQEIQTITDELQSTYRKFFGGLIDFRYDKITSDDVKKLHDAYNAKLKEFKTFVDEIQYLTNDDFEHFVNNV